MNKVLKEIKAAGGEIKRVSITGGDPLHPNILPATYSLVKKLKEMNYFVSLEAAGTYIADEIFSILDFINFDYKTPSTRIQSNPRLIIKMADEYRGKFQVKAVVENREDFDQSLATYLLLKKNLGEINFSWYLTPAYSKEPFPRERFLQVVSWNEQHGGHFRVVGQQHKWLYGANKKRV